MTVRIKFNGPTEFLTVGGQTVSRGSEIRVSEDEAALLVEWADVDVSRVSKNKPAAAQAARGGTEKEGS